MRFALVVACLLFPRLRAMADDAPPPAISQGRASRQGRKGGGCARVTDEAGVLSATSPHREESRHAARRSPRRAGEDTSSGGPSRADGPPGPGDSRLAPRDRRGPRPIRGGGGNKGSGPPFSPKGPAEPPFSFVINPPARVLPGAPI